MPSPQPGVLHHPGPSEGDLLNTAALLALPLPRESPLISAGAALGTGLVVVVGVHHADLLAVLP